MMSLKRWTRLGTRQFMPKTRVAWLHQLQDFISQRYFDEKKNIDVDFVTLHAGAGTFMPVKTEDIDAHQMHSELFSVSESTLNKIKEAKELIEI